MNPSPGICYTAGDAVDWCVAPMTLMPYLSTYMGHVSMEETLYYVHLLPERIKSSPGINWDMMGDIYSAEEDFYEED